MTDHITSVLNARHDAIENLLHQPRSSSFGCIAGWLLWSFDSITEACLVEAEALTYQWKERGYSAGEQLAFSTYHNFVRVNLATAVLSRIPPFQSHMNL